MDDAPALTAHDPEQVLARLVASRWALVHTVMVARIGIAAASLLLAARPGDGPGGSWWNLAAFAAYLTLTVATGLDARRVFDLVNRAPRWLWLEQALCVALVILGGGVRSITVYLCALPVIVATVFIGPRLGAALAAGDSVVVGIVLGGAGLLGVTPGTQHVDGTEWPPALIGLFIAVALFSYVRRLFTELERTGVAYQDRSNEVSAAVAASARAQAQTTALADVTRRLDGVIPDIQSRLAALRTPGGEPWREECRQLERLAAYAQEGLSEFVPQALTSGSQATLELDAVLTSAVTRVAALGSTAIELAVGNCDIGLDRARADSLGRFAEEALWNAHKHGQPPISLTVTATSHAVTVTITDHGAGLQGTARTVRHGLDSLRRDARLLHGVLDLTSEPGQPFSVTLTFPVSSSV